MSAFHVRAKLPTTAEENDENKSAVHPIQSVRDNVTQHCIAEPLPLLLFCEARHMSHQHEPLQPPPKHETHAATVVPMMACTPRLVDFTPPLPTQMAQRHTDVARNPRSHYGRGVLQVPARHHFTRH